MYYDVLEVTALDGHRLLLAFEDGRRGVFDMGGYLDTPFFAPLWNGGRVFRSTKHSCDGCGGEEA